jgi:regulator of sirC expression with transglutaminase-like and TPR domain
VTVPDTGDEDRERLRELVRLPGGRRPAEEERLASAPERFFPALREVWAAARPAERETLRAIGRRAALHEFRRLAALPDQDLPLDQGALSVARWEYPELDPSRPLSSIRGLALRVLTRLAGDREPADVLETLCEVLFTEEGFRGNRERYYDPRNSLLTDVLERRTGTPLSIAIVMLETARRVGLELQGVGLPGHFVVRLPRPGEGDLYLDPFDGGRFLPLADVEKILRTFAPGATLDPYLRPCPPRAMLVRMLNNLKAIYLKGGDGERALAATERILALSPDQASELRDRGFLHLRMHRVEEARRDLSRYLELAPEEDDTTAVREALDSLDERAAERN